MTQTTNVDILIIDWVRGLPETNRHLSKALLQQLHRIFECSIHLFCRPIISLTIHVLHAPYICHEMLLFNYSGTRDAQQNELLIMYSDA